MILWRRRDVPGHDGCRLVATPTGAALTGTAVFREDGVTVVLRYTVACDPKWRATSARVEGWVGDEDVVHVLVREETGWTLDGVGVGNLDRCVDVDLGFTPSTNTLALRRMDLKIGDHAEAPAAYLEFPGFRLRRLDQTYERLDGEHYAYTSDTGYEATLRVDRTTGFVVDYPALWVRED